MWNCESTSKTTACNQHNWQKRCIKIVHRVKSHEICWLIFLCCQTSKFKRLQMKWISAHMCSVRHYTCGHWHLCTDMSACAWKTFAHRAWTHLAMFSYLPGDKMYLPQCACVSILRLRSIRPRVPGSRGNCNYACRCLWHGTAAVSWLRKL